MYDLILNNGKLITGETIHLIIDEGKIIKIGYKEPFTEHGKQILDLNKKSYVSAGWIDSHVHCYEKLALYYDFPDEIGYKSGVTTVIDAGSTGIDNIDDFYKLTQQAKTNVFALLNISRTGITTQDELSNLENIQPELIHQKIEQMNSFIVGLKARISASVVGNNNILPLKLAKHIQKSYLDLPLMVHIGSSPPTLSDILEQLNAGDILTHCFNGKDNGILSEDQKIKTEVLKAHQTGVMFDVGHGTDSFNFKVSQTAIIEKLKADLISTDIYYRNRRNGPVYNFATVLEKMYAVGYSLPEIINKVTVQPANSFKLMKKGHLKLGFDGDMTIFKVIEEPHELVDSNGNHRLCNLKIVPQKTIIKGVVYHIG